MSRTAKYKWTYVAVLLLVVLIAGVAILELGGSLSAVIGVALILLLPGRIQAIYYRDLFTARRLLDAGLPGKAVPLLERFLDSLRQRPNGRKLLWLSWSIYTPDVVAMATNNLGAAQLDLGALNQAEQAFVQALVHDPLYPLPHFNMAVICELRGNRADAAEALERARELGFTGGTLDGVMRKAQSLLAVVEGRG